MNLTKADFVESVYNNCGYSLTRSTAITESTLEIIKKTLESGEDVMISGFGKFYITQKKERKGRNPATGETLMLTPRKIITFKSAEVLRKKLNVINQLSSISSKGLSPFKNIIISYALFVFLSLPFVNIARSETFNATKYFPLESGMEWSYQENGLNMVKEAVLSAYEYVNGIQTKIVKITGGEMSGSKVFYTNDSNGIREHKEFAPDAFIEGVGFVDITVILSPPMKYANQTMSMGEMITSSGNVDYTLSGFGTFKLSYNSSTKVIGFENITVPLGNFNAIKIQSSLTISGYVNAQYVSETSTATYWLAEYIGTIKSKSISSSGTVTRELTDINFSPPISADFSADHTNGLTPLTVTFSDESIGYINDWYWDFGDGNSSIVQNPSHTYNNPGNYTISLSITGLGPGGSDTETKSNFITVEYPPSFADFNVNTTTGIVPLTVSFADISTGIISSWLWDFGDSSTDVNQNPTHTYDSPGTYTVSLTITGPGGSATQKKENYIRAANISADINIDNSVDLEDAIITLQALTSKRSLPLGSGGTTVNGDYKVGLEEAIYILQWISELR